MGVTDIKTNVPNISLANIEQVLAEIDVKVTDMKSVIDRVETEITVIKENTKKELL